jgi:hypothetical protein
MRHLLRGLLPPALAPALAASAGLLGADVPAVAPAPVPAAAGAGRAAEPVPAAAPGWGQPLLLINGDRLTAAVRPGGGSQVGLLAAPGRDGGGGGGMVNLGALGLEVPPDALPYLGRGLDPSLFWPYTPPRMLADMVTWITLLASMVGSVWPGSPWLRSQEVHRWSNWAGLPFDPVAAEPSLARELPLLLAVLLLKFATLGVVDPPPHAAIPVAGSSLRRSTRVPRNHVEIESSGQQSGDACCIIPSGKPGGCCCR